MFLDRTKIIIKAGNGGNGSASFLHTAQTAAQMVEKAAKVEMLCLLQQKI